MLAGPDAPWRQDARWQLEAASCEGSLAQGRFPLRGLRQSGSNACCQFKFNRSRERDRRDAKRAAILNSRIFSLGWRKELGGRKVGWLDFFVIGLSGDLAGKGMTRISLSLTLPSPKGRGFVNKINYMPNYTHG